VTSISLDRLGVFNHRAADRDHHLGLARWADERGLGTLWLNEPGLARDPFVDAAGSMAVTERVGIAIGLTSLWRSLPAVLASQIATLERLGPGRLTMTLGPWHEPQATVAGAVRHDHLAAMRDTTHIVRGLLSGEETTYDGSVFSVRDSTLGVPGPESAVPLLWGVVRPRMLEAAGAYADGVMINYLHSTERVAATIRTVRESAERAGRDPDALQFPAAVLLKVDDDRAGAAEFVRDFVEGTAILRYEAAIPDGYVVTAADAAEWTVLGSPDDCAERLQSYLDAGATSLGIVVMGPAQEMLEPVLVSLGL
jgi:alkanesulfonate monooxygenase SsuD/methylene tetrahydromethanopterin reductase-like flavin-dependent oxidoreductase (luciferase family)